MRKLFANIICMFIFSDRLRRKVRMNIRYYGYIKKCIGFVQRSYGKEKIKQLFGYGCQNVMIVFNNKYVFKFPLPKNGKIDNSRALREARIYNAFKKISPIKIPSMKILKFEDIVVRRYAYINNLKVLSDFSNNDISGKYRKYISRQIAEFLYVIGNFDPQELQDLKKTNAAPDFMYGWCQNDIGGNFLIDEKNMEIKYFIDWEDADFVSFKNTLYSCSNYWEKLGFRGLVVDVLEEYAKIYYEKH